jgi:hypothetical protein
MLIGSELITSQAAFACCGRDAINLTGTSNFGTPLDGRMISDPCWEEWSKVFKKAPASGGPYLKYAMRDSAHFCIQANGGRTGM